jgi:uncharacterized membrane protein
MDIDSPAALIGVLFNATYAITGFAVAQALAYLYATEKTEIRNKIAARKSLVQGSIIAFHTLYVGAIFWCYSAIRCIAKVAEFNSDLFSVYSKIGVGQAFIVGVFGAYIYLITSMVEPNNNGS